MSADRVHILLLAAGSSSRMRGADKLLERIDGHPQIARAARAALSTACPLWVTLPPDRPLRAVALKDLPHTPIPVPDAATGLSASIRTGVAALPESDAILLLLADLPEITGDDLALILQAHHAAPDQIIRATSATGQPGHPVLFPAWTRPALLRLTGDAGARDFLRDHATQTYLISLPDNHAITDLDTPEDWAAWHARR